MWYDVVYSTSKGFGTPTKQNKKASWRGKSMASFEVAFPESQTAIYRELYQLLGVNLFYIFQLLGVN